MKVGRRLGPLALVAAVAAAGVGVLAPVASAAPSRPHHAVAPHGEQGGITADGVRLRTGPGTGYGVKGLLYYGDNVEVLTCHGSWDRVYLTLNSAGGLPAGTNGWVYDAYVDPVTPRPSGC